MLLISGFVLASMLCQSCWGYSSVERIRTAYDVDKNIVETLEKHMKTVEDYKNMVKEYIDEHLLMRLEKDENKIISSPLFAYQIVRRIVLNKQKITNQINQMAREFNEQLDELTVSLDFSYNDHLMEASEGLIRLQDGYRLHPQHLFEGRIGHINTTGRLTVPDCLILAEAAAISFRYDFQVQWLEQAHRACVAQSKTPDVCTYTTQHLYDSARIQHDETREWIMDGNKTGSISQDDYVGILPNATTTTSPLRQRTIQLEADMHPYFDMEKYLCFKGSKLDAKTLSKLSCYYLRRSRDVYVTLQRFQVEQRSLRPAILTIYNVISDRETELIKSLAIPNLARSRVIADEEDKEVSKHRISETSWLNDDEHLELAKISRRISAITGLAVDSESAEEYQVVNYGIGGLYRAHHDYIQNEKGELPIDDDDWSDDRLATFILYLNDVELGGATVFPQAKVAVPPIKVALFTYQLLIAIFDCTEGAATFWYNLNATGHPDVLTMHGGCPVLYGSKWIANKWIHADSQMFRKRCPSIRQP